MNSTLITILVVMGIMFIFIPIFIVPLILYMVLLVRTSPKKWLARYEFPKDVEYNTMFEEGRIWNEAFKNRKKDVSIVSDGLKLVGEYFDFGNDKCVIIIPGRTEASNYSYFFAKPYEEAGYNVLAIDNRCHGRSEGRLSSLGFKEYRDIIAWSQYLHTEEGINAVMCHGICIGSCVALFACVSPDSPEYLKGMVAEGMFPTFGESLWYHLVPYQRYGPMKLFFRITCFYIKHIAGADIVHDGPIKRMSRMDKDILFLHSRQDKYSLPCRAQELYDMCPSKRKQLVWFDVGAHSRIRINNHEKYDAAIRDFLMQ